MSEPRVWVGCLACYNNGTLRGEWVDAIEAGAFTPCTIPGHEEWWCLDHDGFDGLLDSECSPIEAQRIAEVIEHLESWQPVAAFAAWCDYTGNRPDVEHLEAFGDDYCGEFDSEEAYAQELADDIGAVPDDLAWPLSCIDWERATRELFMGDNWSSDAPSGVYVFRRS